MAPKDEENKPGATPATPATPPARAEDKKKEEENKDDALPKSEHQFISNEDNVKQSQKTREAVKIANPGSIDENTPVSEEVKPAPEEEENKKKLEAEQKAFEDRRKKIPQTTKASQGSK